MMPRCAGVLAPGVTVVATVEGRVGWSMLANAISPIVPGGGGGEVCNALDDEAVEAVHEESTGSGDREMRRRLADVVPLSMVVVYEVLRPRGEAVGMKLSLWSGSRKCWTTQTRLDEWRRVSLPPHAFLQRNFALSLLLYIMESEQGNKALVHQVAYRVDKQHLGADMVQSMAAPPWRFQCIGVL